MTTRYPYAKRRRATTGVKAAQIAAASPAEIWRTLTPAQRAILSSAGLEVEILLAWGVGYSAAPSLLAALGLAPKEAGR